MTVYYRDAIEQEDLIINEETFLYLVQCGDTQNFALRAIKKVYLEKIIFDPYTRALKYWPVNLENLFAIENNEEERTKILYCEHDSQRLILSSHTLTRKEVNNLLKIDPISDNFEIDTDSEINTNITKINSINFDSHSSSSEEALLFFIEIFKLSIDVETQNIFSRLELLNHNAKLAHFACENADISQRLKWITTLVLIKNECESIKHKIDELAITLFALNNLYANILDSSYVDSLLSVRTYCSIICDTIEEVCIEYLQEFDDSSLDSSAVSGPSQNVISDAHSQEVIESHLNTSRQNNEEEISIANNRSDNCINTTINNCLAFFNSMMPTIPMNEASYPYNRTRLRL